MKLAIIGSRSFEDYELLRRTIADLSWRWVSTGPDGEGRNRCQIDEVISGGAAGADSLGARWVEEHNKEGKEGWYYLTYDFAPIKLTVFKPDWAKYGKRAGFLRNEDIVKAADMVLAFWNGSSKGTANSLAIAKRLKKPTMIIYF
jgi:hypothetical protein